MHRCHTDRTMCRLFVVALAIAGFPAWAQANGQPLDAVHRLFYNARYEEALRSRSPSARPSPTPREREARTPRCCRPRGLLKGRLSRWRPRRKRSALPRCPDSRPFTPIAPDKRSGGLVKATRGRARCSISQGTLITSAPARSVSSRRPLDEYCARGIARRLLNINPKHVPACRARLAHFIVIRAFRGDALVLGGAQEEGSFPRCGGRRLDTDTSTAPRPSSRSWHGAADSSAGVDGSRARLPVLPDNSNRRLPVRPSGQYDVGISRVADRSASLIQLLRAAAGEARHFAGARS